MNEQKLQGRRIDPEPFTIIGAVAGVIGAAFGGVALLKDYFRDTPHQTRAKVLRLVNELEDEVRYLRSDLDAIEQLFNRSEFTVERTVRLGNGALMTTSDFELYARTSDQVFVRLRKINSLTLRLEREISHVPWIDQRVAARSTGRAIEQLETVLTTRDLSIERAWTQIRQSMQELERLARAADDQLR